MALPKEKDLQFETITNHLLSNGYELGENRYFDHQYKIFREDMIRFLTHTQEKVLEEYKKSKGSNWEKELFALIDSNINKRGIMRVLKDGVKSIGLSSDIKLMYFVPNSNKNETLINKYKENIFKVTNEFYYNPEKGDRIDTVISINGLPLIFIELKNTLTGQNYINAVNQWKNDRSSKEEIFQQRAIVFFAVDDNEVHMATKLDDKNTFFLPFNKGNNLGKGNPPHKSKHKTHYLWEDILSKDTLTDIINRFYYIQEEASPNSKEKKEKRIFPRYHQLDVVRKIINDVKVNGSGKNYLIQHSAGSGKTNSISWLAHRLSSLHNDKDEVIFNSIIVITDRRVLDKQLQDAIYQLEHKHGVVERIDDSKKSSDLAKAIENNKKIIITTIQKFPYALEQIENLSGKNYGVIIDEAHSSTAGESMGALKMTLAGKTQEEMDKTDVTSDDIMAEFVGKRSKLDNISFFAFTATPKAKTLEIFGTMGEDNKPHEFHLYSMKQAIEEGFIIDILKHYSTYKRYYKVAKTVEDSPEFDKGKASRAIRRFVELDEYNIREKVRVIVEDFRLNREMWLGGKSKGMVVTSSRLSAVKYKLAIDKYLKEIKSPMKTLVAFSGKIEIDDMEYTENTLNNIGKTDIKVEFEKDEYKLLIVAEKYQTGFDQPKLCAMYVDKGLGGVKCVQTLSRLNRTYKDKQTFILDFVNKVEEIQDSFKPYYEKTEIKEVTDPNTIFDKFYEIKEYPVYDEELIDEFAMLYFKKKRTAKQDAKLNSLLDQSVEVAIGFDEEKLDEFKGKAREYINLYKFLIQIYPIINLELLRLYVFLVGLYKKLPVEQISGVNLNELLSLDYYKLSQTSEGDISIGQGGEELQGVGEGKSGKKEEELEGLDLILARINDLYGIGITEENKVMIENIEKVFINNTKLIESANANEFDDFHKVFEKHFKRGLIRQKKEFGKIITDILSNEGLSNYLLSVISQEVYKEVRKS